MLASVIHANKYESLELATADTDFINKIKVRYKKIDGILSRIVSNGSHDTDSIEDGICSMLSSLSVEAKFKKYRWVGSYPELVFSNYINNHVSIVGQYFMSGDFTARPNINIDKFLAEL